MNSWCKTSPLPSGEGSGVRATKERRGGCMADARAGSPHPSALPEGEGTPRRTDATMDDGGDGPAEDLRRRHGTGWPPPSARTAVSPAAAAQRRSYYRLRAAGPGHARPIDLRRGWPRRRFSPPAPPVRLPPRSSSRCWPGRSWWKWPAAATSSPVPAVIAGRWCWTFSGRSAAATAATPRAPQHAEQPLSNLPGRALRGNGGPRPRGRRRSSRWSGPAAAATAVSRNWTPSSRAARAPRPPRWACSRCSARCDEGAREGVVRFLAAMQTPAGGLRACPAAAGRPVEHL